MSRHVLAGIVRRRHPSGKEFKMLPILSRLLFLGAALALSACSGGKPPYQFESNGSATADAIHGPNAKHEMAGMGMASIGDPDADFLKGMIPHHEGAVEMARKELASGTDPRVRAMATAMIAAQQAEIRTMKTWLAERQAAKTGDR